MKAFAKCILVFSTIWAFCLPVRGETIYEKPGEVQPSGKIDELIFARLKAKGVQPARLCSDAVFLRRVYLDLTGTLPSADQAEAFLSDAGADKRSQLIDQLMRRDEFADYWAMRWGDVLRIKSEFPINLWPNAVQAYHRWLRAAMADNMPYDTFVRELLTASGSNFRVPAVNFYRAAQSNTPEALAKAAALTFMGDRMDSWPDGRRTGMAAFFSRAGYKKTAEWKEEVVFFDRSSKPIASAVLPDGTVPVLDGQRDPRQVFADWLISPDNPWFARCIVNRIWYWLMGRGIVHEPDDFRPDNPPAHPDVLALLAAELVDARYDLRHIMRLILNSSTYQLSSVLRSDHPDAVTLFAGCPITRLDAEVLIDAICQVTGTTEEYSSQIPEPFTWVPPDKRTIALGDGSITSSFLDMFGRPPRDTGMLSERNNAVTAAQRLHLLNSSHVRNKIERGAGLRQLRTRGWRDLSSTVQQLYLTILSRRPTSEEKETVQAYAGSSGGRRNADAFTDVVWALVNSPEFLCRH